VEFNYVVYGDTTLRESQTSKCASCNTIKTLNKNNPFSY
jgi:hypothetical protein